MVMVQVAVKNCDDYKLFYCNHVEIITTHPCLNICKYVDISESTWNNWTGLAIDENVKPYNYYYYTESITLEEFVRLFNEQLQSEAKPKNEAVNHPNHYGGENNPLEVINIIEHYELGFHLGNVVKYVLRAGKKGNRNEDLKKALWYIEREIKKGGENG